MSIAPRIWAISRRLKFQENCAITLQRPLERLHVSSWDVIAVINCVGTAEMGCENKSSIFSQSQAGRVAQGQINFHYDEKFFL